MSSAKAEAIRVARQVRQQYCTENQPLADVFQKIFDAKNITLEYDVQGALTECFPGKNPEETSWQITLPYGTSAARDNFTIAHELGHIFLDHPLDRDNKIARSGLSTLTEVAANAFAAEFLMPEDEFRKEAQRCGNNERVLAEKFSVSQSAALIRMIALGIIS